MAPEQISNFVLGFLMKRGKPTEDGSVSATLTIERQAGRKPSNFTLLWSPGRPHDVIDIDRIRIWAHDRLVFDAEFLTVSLIPITALMVAIASAHLNAGRGLM